MIIAGKLFLSAAGKCDVCQVKLVTCASKLVSSERPIDCDGVWLSCLMDVCESRLLGASFLQTCLASRILSAK